MRKLIFIALLTAGCTSMAHNPIDDWAMDIIDSRFGDQIPDAYELDYFEKCHLLAEWDYLSGPKAPTDDELIYACAIITNDQLGDEQCAN